MLNSLDSDQAQCFVGSDLGPNCKVWPDLGPNCKVYLQTTLVGKELRENPVFVA